jgi:ferredoxin
VFGDAVLELAGLDALIAALHGRGYRVIGPRVEEGAIVLGELAEAADLPIGVTDVQGPGRYRLARRADAARFGFVVGPQSFKRHFHVPIETLFRVRKDGRGFEVVETPVEGPPLALFGARACDLAALAVQDQVLAEGVHPDPRYQARRKDTFVVAVACNAPGASCFCASMNTGPRPTEGFDLALTELLPAAGAPHRFYVEVGSARGEEVLASVEHALASDAERARATELADQAASAMTRALDTRHLRDLLLDNPEHPRWAAVAERCLACTSCTLVCPTCFCSSVDDVTTLDGDAERVRRWDSCFTAEYSYVHGGPTRPSVAARYRHWLTHKLAGWIDQFGRSGCVGCGRCITWCPAGIDLTEEVAALRAAAPAGRPAKES